VSGAPYVLLNVMNYSPDLFGWLFASAAIGYVLGAIFNAKLSSKLGFEFMSTWGISSLICGAILMTLGSYVYPNNIFLILLPQMICEFGISIVMSNMVSKALQSIPHCAGAGSALIGFFRFLLATFCSYLIITFQGHSSLPLALTILSCSFFCWICWKFVKKRKTLVIFLDD
jgi:DHA1 family bicyclomycin/chloramphenicol resistance-like MFS transporter